MEAYNFFIDREGHLRSGWRLAIFIVAFLICLQITHLLLVIALSTALNRSTLEIGETLFVSILIFLFAAAAEEILFRGYVLQTLTRANIAWLGIVLTSVPFAAAHLKNPNAVPGFTFVNTALAGLWLAVAYLRTRSLWLPFGLHWSWNWAQASLLGLPVSGIERIAPAPLLKAMNAGPDWLTGGAYGIEGGAACTIALLLSTAVIWRAKLFARADVPRSISHR